MLLIQFHCMFLLLANSFKFAYNHCVYISNMKAGIIDRLQITKEQKNILYMDF